MQGVCRCLQPGNISYSWNTRVPARGSLGGFVDMSVSTLLFFCSWRSVKRFLLQSLVTMEEENKVSKKVEGKHTHTRLPQTNTQRTLWTF